MGVRGVLIDLGGAVYQAEAAGLPPGTAFHDLTAVVDHLLGPKARI